MFPTLTAAQVARVAAHGRVRLIGLGEVLVEAGAAVLPFFVVTAGHVDIVRPAGIVETLITVLGPGEFTGEVNMLSGRARSSRARERAGEVIELSREQLLALVQTDASSARFSCGPSSFAGSS